MTSQGDRDALREAVRDAYVHSNDSLDNMLHNIVNAILALPDVLLRVLLDTQKPCPEYHHNAFGAEAPCATCDGGSVPLVDREQVLAALGMERVSSRRWNPEWNVWDYWTPEGFEAEGDHRGWEPVFAFRVPVPEPSEGDDR